MSCFLGGLDGSQAWPLTSQQVSAYVLPVLTTHPLAAGLTLPLKLSTPCSSSLRLLIVLLCHLLLDSKLMMPFCGLPSRLVLLTQAADVLV